MVEADPANENIKKLLSELKNYSSANWGKKCTWTHFRNPHHSPKIFLDNLVTLVFLVNLVILTNLVIL